MSDIQNRISLANDQDLIWGNNAWTGFVNMFKVNTDDKIEPWENLSEITVEWESKYNNTTDMVYADKSFTNKEYIDNSVPFTVTATWWNCGTFDWSNDYIDTNKTVAQLWIDWDDAFTISFNTKFSALSKSFFWGRAWASWYQWVWTEISWTWILSLRFFQNATLRTDYVVTWALSTATDYNIVITYDWLLWDDSCKIFYNWVEQTVTKTLVWSGHVTWSCASAYNLYVWALNTAGSDWLNIAWNIYNFFIYSKVLTQSEVYNINNWWFIDDSITIWYPLSEWWWIISYDVSWNGYNWTITDATLSTFWGTTQDNIHYNLNKWHTKAMLFDWVDDFVDLSSQKTLNANDHSVFLRIIPHETWTDESLIWNTTALNYTWLRFNASNQLEYRGDSWNASTTNTITRDWNEITIAAIRTTSTNVKYYVNWVYLEDVTGSYWSFEIWRIWARTSWAFLYPFNWSILEVKFFDSQLTGSDVLDLHNRQDILKLAVVDITWYWNTNEDWVDLSWNWYNWTVNWTPWLLRIPWLIDWTQEDSAWWILLNPSLWWWKINNESESTVVSTLKNNILKIDWEAWYTDITNMIYQDESFSSKKYTDDVIPFTSTALNSNYISFDWSDDNIVFADSSDWDFGTWDFSIDFWMIPADVTSSSQTLVWFTIASWLFQIDQDVSNLRVIMNWENTLSAAHGMSVWTAYHISYIRVSWTAQIYVDGSSIDSDTQTTAPTVTWSVYVWTRADWSTSPYEWDMYWFRVTKWTLTAADLASVKDWSDIIDTTKIKCYCPMSEWNWTIVYDISWNWNNWTITNATLSSFWVNWQDNLHYNLTKWHSKTMYFDWSNDYISLPSDMFVNNNVLVSFYVNLEENVDSCFLTTQDDFYLYIASFNSTWWKVRLQATIWSTWYNIESDSWLTLNKWTHVVAVKNNTDWLLLYIDWVLQADVDATATWNLDAVDTWNRIGIYWNDASYQLKWSIKDIQVCTYTANNLTTLLAWNKVTNTNWLICYYEWYWNTASDWLDTSWKWNNGTVNWTPAVIRTPALLDLTEDWAWWTVLNPPLWWGKINNECESEVTQTFLNQNISFPWAVFWNITTVNTAIYDLLTTDFILNVTYTATAAVTSLTLPTAQTTSWRIVIVKDAWWNASLNNITIDTEWAETIDWSATAVISWDYDSVSLYCDWTNRFIY